MASLEAPLIGQEPLARWPVACPRGSMSRRVLLLALEYYLVGILARRNKVPTVHVACTCRYAISHIKNECEGTLQHSNMRTRTRFTPLYHEPSDHCTVTRIAGRVGPGRSPAAAAPASKSPHFTPCPRDRAWRETSKANAAAISHRLAAPAAPPFANT